MLVDLRREHGFLRLRAGQCAFEGAANPPYRRGLRRKIVISSARMMDELNAAVEDLPEVTVLLAEQIDRRPPVPAKVSRQLARTLQQSSTHPAPPARRRA